MIQIKDNAAIIEMILDFEGRGKAECVPGDRGGLTKYGLTKRALIDLGRQKVTDDDIRNLTLDDARQIYQEVYLNRPNYHLIESLPLRALVVDTAVNMGTGTASRMLQHAVGAKPDGIIGIKTLSLVNSLDPAVVYDSVWIQRRARYLAIVDDDPSQKKFLAGWMARCDALA